ncbi:histidinol-phosphate transaminase [Aureispira anguillae]|uniref:Histidinol-phosphate aminotransferase n=1 Tax=Aureispira anguillae TaxID=2864201 RepID=A0A915YF21_9BACT|nr:histidinol-phosphate transaminase [Aureispira anguillae]BDS11839.1 histidinol-phosphate transaminase [Aureispira anguillae]
MNRTKTIEALVNPHIISLQAYSSARSEFKGSARIFLDANENALSSPYNRYPDPLQGNLKKAIATYLKLDAAQIFLGNGSDEAIDLLLRIFCISGQDAIITLPPTYGMYEVSATINRVKNITIPLQENFQPDVEAILAAQNEQTKILFICSPNNPTGNDISLVKIEQLIKEFDGIVVVDEAYIHFSAQESCLKWLDTYPNLVILQTFSKAWGMAGIRLGMAIASPTIVALFNKVKPPYNINQLTQSFALERLQNANDLYQTIRTILSERTVLKNALIQLPFVVHVYPSAANFLLVKVKQADALYRYLVEKGIVVRNRNAVVLCDNCLRITIGSAAENKQLLFNLSNYKKNKNA